MVVEADCIPGGIDGEAPDRKQVLDRREIQGVLDFGQKIKTEGNEARGFWKMVSSRYCQGDEMLKNFAAEPHLDKENKALPVLAVHQSPSMVDSGVPTRHEAPPHELSQARQVSQELKTMHRQCLNNKANAALQMDQWQTALRAAESALKLKMDDEKAEIKAIEHKAARSFNNMFKAMGDKQVEHAVTSAGLERGNLRRVVDYEVPVVVAAAKWTRDARVRSHVR
eukprot:Skav227378  [mRNA]  locus=scaffold1390:63767:73259:- [translate_table: standard]